jgi:purine-binding chemotaxis protein CheW
MERPLKTPNVAVRSCTTNDSLIMLERAQTEAVYMATTNALQLVTFQLGAEHYGIDIMEVEGIVKVEDVRSIPNAPAYVEGIFKLRGEIIPVINLHRRFHIKEATLSEEDRLLSGFMIINIDGRHLAVAIDKVSRVVSVDVDQIQPPPEVITGIGAQYIEGVVNSDDGYLIILDIHRLFNVRELQQLEQIR